MRIAFGSDHAGFDLKSLLIDYVRSLGHDVEDLGAYDKAPSDYPDYSEKVGLAVAGGQVDRGILICGSGIGASVAANKIVGVRAGNVTDTYSGHQGVEHDQMNVLVLGSRVLGTALATEIVHAYLGADFSGEERHVRRLAKLAAIERRQLGGPN